MAATVVVRDMDISIATIRHHKNQSIARGLTGKHCTFGLLCVCTTKRLYSVNSLVVGKKNIRLTYLGYA